MQPVERLHQRIAHQRLARLCFIDYARDMALVVEPEGGSPTSSILAVGRLARISPTEAEFALLVADAHQGQGLGSELLRRLLEIGRAEGLRRIVAEMSPGNSAMQAISRKLGFRLDGEPGVPSVQAVIDL